MTTTTVFRKRLSQSSNKTLQKVTSAIFTCTWEEPPFAPVRVPERHERDQPPNFHLLTKGESLLERSYPLVFKLAAGGGESCSLSITPTHQASTEESGVTESFLDD